MNQKNSRNPRLFQRTGGTRNDSCFTCLRRLDGFASAIANGLMVPNKAIQNDPAKEALCAKKAKVKPVQFLIDQNYVNITRAAHPDTTFIAEDGILPELIDCRASEQTGVYELDALSSDENAYWHLVRPEAIARGYQTAAWQVQADNVCFKAAREKVNRDQFDRSFGYMTDVNVITLNVAPWYLPGVKVAGMKTERYDFAVVGQLLYKSSGSDLTVYRATCKLSPALEVKAVQANKESADRELKMETRFEVPFRM
jgi:hypothetical protein